MIPRDVPVKLSVLAKATGWGVTVLRDACRDGEMEGWKVGADWVASIDGYCEWLNGKTGKRRRDNQENTVREMAGSSPNRREVDKRADSRPKDRRAANAPPKARPRVPVVYERDGTELRVEKGGVGS